VLIDGFLPDYEFTERHSTLVRATPDAIEPHVRALDLSGSRVVRLLLRLRGMSGGAIGLEGLERAGFRILGEAPGREIVLGLIGRFWTPSGALCRFEPVDFVAFDEPGWAKAVWNFSLEAQSDGRTLLATETRVHCTDPKSRRRFRAYWTVVRPFSGLIRRIALREIKGRAERAAEPAR
jgi:hypothetical protein